MLKEICSFLVVLEEGSANRAAKRLGVAQPTLSRHIQALEQEMGASLFERDTSGMRATDFGFFVRDRFAPLVKDYQLAMAEAFAFAKGRHGQLRVGFIGSAAAKHLNPALASLKREFPHLKLFLFDQTPSEQLQALRDGRIDVALIGQDAASQCDEFYQRSAARLGVCAALSADHPFAGRSTLSLVELKAERFIGVAEDAAPGRNAWISELCRKSGFRPQFLSNTSSIAETFAWISGENAVALLPDYMNGPPPPNVTFVPLVDRHATWNLMVLRQRGAGSSGARRLVDLITTS
jgi:DNA-binding transcriptional LysR family regulator